MSTVIDPSGIGFGRDTHS